MSEYQHYVQDRQPDSRRAADARASFVLDPRLHHLEKSFVNGHTWAHREIGAPNNEIFIVH